VDPTLQFVWGHYRAWASTAQALKDRIRKTGLLVMALTLVGTAIGTLTPSLIGHPDTGVAKVLGLVRRRCLEPRPI